MIPQTIFGKFLSLFPEFKDKTKAWFPNGKNCVRVRLLSKQEVIFTYDSPNNWIFETADSYLKRIERSS